MQRQTRMKGTWQQHMMQVVLTLIADASIGCNVCLCVCVSALCVQHLGARMRGKIQVVKINHDKYPELASKHGVHALPTLVRRGTNTDPALHTVAGALSDHATLWIAVLHMLAAFLFAARVKPFCFLMP